MRVAVSDAQDSLGLALTLGRRMGRPRSNEQYDG